MSELLSPAGTKEAFYAAISNGCNAIYLGVNKFSARAYANNFNLEDLKELVDFAHLRKVKIFVTMNTILYDEELSEAYQTVDELAKMHVDAIIVQDLALLNYIVNHYKSLEAHASTQMGIDDIFGARVVKKLGATRIVFARETPLETIKEVKDKLNIETEAFIHGALCVAYSGNCLMSSMIGDRSGNRGRCAGCCRQKYTLIDVNNNKIIKTGYLLSMKDLNTSHQIDEMRFIDSLKIEGRMKEPVYVGGVTNFYRRLLDNQKLDFNELNKVFNRTYTKGFMNHDNGSEITNITRPNNFGYPIGKIVKINKDTIWIKLFEPLNKGDQIRIESSNELEEISVPVIKLFDANFKECLTQNKMAIISCHSHVNLGAKVYKTKDVEYNKKIEETFKNKEYKKLNIDFKFTGKIGLPLTLNATFEGINVEEKSDFICEKSIKSSTTKENIFNQLNKLNETPYQIKNLDIDLDENAFIPLKLINELRRNVIEKINEFRLDLPIIPAKPKQINVKPYDLIEPQITVQVKNSSQYEMAKSLGIEHIYYQNIVRRNNEKYVENSNEILIGGLGGLDAYKNKNVKLISDYSFNVSNYQTVGLLNSLGIDRITLSQEINKDHINALINNYFEAYKTYPNLELIVYGRSVLMHSKYCPLKRLGICGECKKSNFALKDRFESFPLSFNDDCTINVLNSKKLNIMDDVSRLKGVNYFRLVFNEETPEEVKNIIERFKKILNKENNNRTFNSKENTRGHFINNPL